MSCLRTDPVSVSKVMENESPVNKFMVQVNVLDMTWFPCIYILQAPLDSISHSNNGTVDWISWCIYFEHRRHLV